MPKDPRATSPRDSDRLAYALEVINRPDPNATAKAAETALELARGAGSSPLREKYIADAQVLIGQLDPRRQAHTIQNLQGAVLALQGRGDDTQIAHVTLEELVIPKRMQTPELMAMLARAAQQAGIDPRRLRVGSGQRNPKTGHEEFFGASDLEQIPVTTNRNSRNLVLDRGESIEGPTVTLHLNDEIRRAQAVKDRQERNSYRSGGLAMAAGAAAAYPPIAPFAVPIGMGFGVDAWRSQKAANALGSEIDQYRAQQSRMGKEQMEDYRRRLEAIEGRYR